MQWRFKFARFFFVEFDVRQKMSINRTGWFGFECRPALRTVFFGGGPGVVANSRGSDRFFRSLCLLMTHNLSNADGRSSLQHGIK